MQLAYASRRRQIIQRPVPTPGIYAFAVDVCAVCAAALQRACYGPRYVSLRRRAMLPLTFLARNKTKVAGRKEERAAAFSELFSTSPLISAVCALCATILGPATMVLT